VVDAAMCHELVKSIVEALVHKTRSVASAKPGPGV
jgi:hypothetical protein